jgi:hypothetical protein
MFLTLGTGKIGSILGGIVGSLIGLGTASKIFYVTDVADIKNKFRFFYLNQPSTKIRYSLLEGPEELPSPMNLQ